MYLIHFSGNCSCKFIQYFRPGQISTALFAEKTPPSGLIRISGSGKPECPDGCYPVFPPRSGNGVTSQPFRVRNSLTPTYICNGPRCVCPDCPPRSTSLAMRRQNNPSSLCQTLPVMSLVEISQSLLRLLHLISRDNHLLFPCFYHNNMYISDNSTQVTSPPHRSASGYGVPDGQPYKWPQK